MYEDMRVKYLFINMRYPAYIKLQVILVVSLVIASLLCFLFARDSQIWLLKNAWWLCLIVAVGEIVETFMAIGKAKKKFHASKQE